MMSDVEKQSEYQMESTSPAPHIATDSTPAIEIQQRAGSGDLEAITLLDQGETAIAIAQEPETVTGSARIGGPRYTPWRGRKWPRPVETLARGERWKRRLPAVCW
jgi:hypothetical protein